MKHLRVLESTGLVTTRRVGREKHHYLNPVPIRRLHDRWLDKYRARAAASLLDLQRALERPATDNLEGNPMTSTAAPAFVHAVYIRATPGRSGARSPRPTTPCATTTAARSRPTCRPARPTG